MTSRFPPFAFVELVSPYNKKNITRWLEDMNFMFSWQKQYLTRSLRSLVRYCSCYSNIKFISSRHRVISSMYYLTYSPDWPGAHEKAKQRIINLLWLQCVYHVSIVVACKLRWSYLYFYLFLYLLFSVMTSSSDCDVLMNKELLLPMSFYKRCFLLRTFGSLAWTKRHTTKHYLIIAPKTLNI